MSEPLNNFETIKVERDGVGLVTRMFCQVRW
jgi:hypothetical protein